MLDIKLLRKEPDTVRAAMDARGETVDLDAILALDAERRALVHDMEQLRAEQNKASGEIAKAKKAKEDASEAIAAMREVSGRIKGFEEQVREKDAVLRDALLRVPNLPHDSTPVGADENANVEVRKWSEPTQFEFDPKDHVDIGTALGILDFETAARISGARFTLLRGAGARLERALIAWMLDTHADEHGYTEMLPPFLVASASMEASGQLPKFAEEAFSLTNGDYWLNPTAEVPLTSVHRDEILTEDNLPLHYVAYAPSFRSEAGSYGKDTRGMLRQHQFDKVELYKFAKPEDSWDELEALTQNAETILQKLNLPYRVMALCTGDIGFGSAKTYDLEVWLPGQDTYREISSCSNCTDFQARRANIRFRRGKQVEFVHTLNGSGLAVGRTLIAIVENYQQADGSVVVPDVLRPYMGGLKVIAAS